LIFDELKQDRNERKQRTLIEAGEEEALKVERF
jgi:hypothetical protein